MIAPWRAVIGPARGRGGAVTGVAVCTAAPGSAEWLAARRGYVGASEIAALFGAHPFMTELDVWNGKVHPDLVDVVDSERVWWGTRLEPVIRDSYAATLDDVVVSTAPDDIPSIIAHPVAPVAASLDALAHHPDRDEVWEIKNSDLWRAWADDATPLAYWMQVQVQLAVTGLEQGLVVALVRGNDLQVRRIEADRAWQSEALERAEDWWDTHVIGGVMPDPDPTGDAAKLGRLWTPDAAKTVDLDPLLAAELVERKTVFDEAKRAFEETRAQVQLAMRDAAAAVDPASGEVVATWRARAGSRRVRVDDFEAFLAEAAGLIRTSDATRTFTVTGGNT